MLELTPQEVIIRRVKRPARLAEAVSVAALLAIRSCLSLTANATLKKTRPTGSVLPSDASTAKSRKAKE